MSSDGFPYPLKRDGEFPPLHSGDITAEQLLPFGYASGGYMMKCRTCGAETHNVDKRAIRCWQCAVNAFRAQEVMIKAHEQRMQTVAGQDEARRELLLSLSQSVAESAKGGLNGEHIVSVLTGLLSQEVRLLNERLANERSYQPPAPAGAFLSEEREMDSDIPHLRAVLDPDDIALLRTLSGFTGYTLGQRCKDAGLPSDRRGLAAAHARMCHMEREGLVRQMDREKPIIWLLTAKGQAEIDALKAEAV